MSKQHIFYNNFATALTNAISSSATSALLDDVTGLVDPATDEVFTLTLFDVATGDLEIIAVSSLSGNTVTIARNQEGTTGPGGGWAAGATLEARITGGSLANLVQGARGRRSTINDLPEWTANTYIDWPGLAYRRGTSNVMLALNAGTTSGIQPTGTGLILDNEVWWRISSANGSESMFEAGEGAISFGNGSTAQGDYSVAVGYAPTATGAFAVAFGNAVANGNRAFAGDRSASFGANSGADNQGFAGGYYAFAGWDGISIGPYAGNTWSQGARRSEHMMMFGANTYGGAAFSISMSGHPIILPFIGGYTSGESHDDDTALQSTGEAVIYSVPVNLGDGPVWLANHSYEHGTVVFPTVANGKCYVSKCKPGGAKYFEPETSGATEPAWPTSAGSSKSDGDVTWYCVDPTDILLNMGDYSRFTPTAVGFICDEDAAPTSQPTISFGISGNATKWLAGTATTKLSGSLSNHFFEPSNTEGSKTLAAALVTAGTGPIPGRFVFKGLVTETPSV
ncbi:MAG: hypothetical protein JKX92_06150 [Porticoccaceae bacterium]|nr:hypothetical protein [Porticoccaceae bacterium]